MARLVFILLLVHGSVQAQPRFFDVATIRVSPPQETLTAIDLDRIRVNPGTLVMRNVTLARCLQWAYGIPMFQVTGPGWISRDLYVLTAKSEEKASLESMQLMLQTLLKKRMGVAIHHESREMQVMLLSPGKNFHPPSAGDGASEISMEVKDRVLRLGSASFSEFAEFLSKVLRTPVLDSTRASGRFDLTINVTALAGPDRRAANEGEAILAAMEQQLGLRLERKKMAVDVIVVDQANPVPTEN